MRPVAWRHAIRESALGQTAKLVAHTLSTYMDANGDAWPSLATLARGSSLSVPSVVAAVQRLEDARLLSVERSAGGSGRSNRYHAACPETVNDVDGSTVNEPDRSSGEQSTSFTRKRKNQSKTCFEEETSELRGSTNQDQLVGEGAGEGSASSEEQSARADRYAEEGFAVYQPELPEQEPANVNGDEPSVEAEQPSRVCAVCGEPLSVDAPLIGGQFWCDEHVEQARTREVRKGAGS
jgi:hypothetical protein